MFCKTSSWFLVLFTVAIAGCGHDVTPIPDHPNSDLSGKIVIKFQTNGPLDFNNVVYVIAIDSCGTGVPYPQAFVTGFSSFTFSFVIGGGFGNTAEPRLIEYYLPQGGSQLAKISIDNLNPSTTQFYSPYEGASNEFELIFPRSVLNEPVAVQYPCPDSPSEPGPSPSATPDDATGIDSPPYVTTWTLNVMTFDAAGNALDSLGSGGPKDTSFPGIRVDTTGTNQYPFFRGAPFATPAMPAAYITYAEVDTYANTVSASPSASSNVKDGIL